MAGRLVDRKRHSVQHSLRRTKVKTGCKTCRIRKIKCDEGKPSCQKCVTTGRACDGYEAPFRFFTASQPDNTQTISQDVDFLNRCFSTKTVFDGVNIDCNEEAKQVLQASLTEPSIRYAVAALRALREDFETSGLQQTPRYESGLQQYGMALEALASNLSSPSPTALKSTLLCCQVLISIEQARGDFAAMGQHIIQGLGIMRENRENPYFAVFVIKMFATPCKFAERPAPDNTNEATASCPFRRIAPDKRTELTGIALSALEFLGRISRAESGGDAHRQLLSEKASLMDSLESWLIDLNIVHVKETRSPGPEPLSASFMRFFHQTLKIVLLGALDSSPDPQAKLSAENDRLRCIATDVGERVKSYYTCGGTGGGPTGVA